MDSADGHLDYIASVSRRTKAAVQRARRAVRGCRRTSCTRRTRERAIRRDARSASPFARDDNLPIADSSYRPEYPHYWAAKGGYGSSVTIRGIARASRSLWGGTRRRHSAPWRTGHFNRGGFKLTGARRAGDSDPRLVLGIPESPRRRRSRACAPSRPQPIATVTALACRVRRRRRRHSEVDYQVTSRRPPGLAQGRERERFDAGRDRHLRPARGETSNDYKRPQRLSATARAPPATRRRP